MRDESTHRFEPNQGALLREPLLIGAVVAILGPGLLYLEGERNMLLLGLLGAIGGALGWGIYALRTYLRGVRSLALTPQGVILALRRKEVVIAWDQITAVAHRTHYGDFVALTLHGQKRPQLYLLDGYSPAAIQAIIAQIRDQLHQQEANRR